MKISIQKYIFNRGQENPEDGSIEVFENAGYQFSGNYLIVTTKTFVRVFYFASIYQIDFEE